MYQLHDHGRNLNGEIRSWGRNSRMDNLQAAIDHAKSGKPCKSTKFFFGMDLDPPLAIINAKKLFFDFFFSLIQHFFPAIL